MLKNVKITGKLLLGFGLLIAIIALIAGFGAYQINVVQARYSNVLRYPTVRYSTLRDIEVGLTESRRMMKLASAYSSEAPEIRSAALSNQQRDVEELRRNIVADFQNYRRLVEADPTISAQDRNFETARLNDIETAIFRYIDVYISQVMTAARQGDTQTALNVIRNGGTTINQAYVPFNELFSYMKNYMETVDSQLASQTFRSQLIMVAAGLFAMLVGVITAFLISGSVGTPLRRLAHMVEDVSDGKLNVNINHAGLGKDEVGTLTEDVYILIETIRSINDDLTLYAQKLGKEGDYEYRMNADKYKGAFRDLINGVHAAVDSEAEEAWIMMDAIDAIDVGNFDVRSKRLPGKRARVNQKLDSFLDHLHHTTEQIDLMIEAAADKGDMEFHVDTKGTQGGWFKILNGLNHIAEEIDKPIVEIRDVMSDLAKGKFSHKVEGNYKGDFLTMKNSVNDMIETLSGYISQISGILTAVASGDLTKKITRDYVGDFSAIKLAINSISDTLSKSMAEITMASKYVLEGANKITTSAIELADGSSAQAASLEELHSTVDMINKQTQKFADNAKEANALSEKSTNNAQEGHNAMTHMLQAMSQIKESSNDISRIIKVIQDIAFQTNLLALNAAVEAARAGEHGKGFAVVAEEVRSLAARSQDAASETTNLISDSISRVESGTAIANTTSESLNAIVTSADEVMSLISNITNAAGDQAKMITDISKTLLTTATTVQNNSKFAHEAAATAEELNSQSEMLQQLVAYFKL